MEYVSLIIRSAVDGLAVKLDSMNSKLDNTILRIDSAEEKVDILDGDVTQLRDGTETETCEVNLRLRSDSQPNSSRFLDSKKYPCYSGKTGQTLDDFRPNKNTNRGNESEKGGKRGTLSKSKIESENIDPKPGSSKTEDVIICNDTQRETHTPTVSCVRNFSLFYQNVRGVRTKLQDLRVSVRSADYDCIVLTETWLNDCIDTQELSFDNYDVFRFDRNVLTGEGSRGGGVLVAVKRHLNAVLLSTNCKTIEHLFVKIGYFSLIIGAFYIPPCASLDTFSCLCRTFEDLLIPESQNPVCIVGDFNVPFISWNNNNKNEPSCTAKLNCSIKLHKDIANVISDTLDFLDFSQINKIPNTFGSILDLVFCNFSELDINLSYDPLLPVDNFHPPLLLMLHLNNIETTDNFQDSHSGLLSYNFKNADMAAINLYLNDID
ncbi:uncharacterized protein LOC122504518 [Leptopilina heterotoma]|uniref:uncharacterized protein LOC122504518 n=1 Tax=Leptopilina heterotoma TaxID=63436 RepID=UPI001CA9CAB1|nr:uncharacterized protein LOC122504518 [Leptopilina heterotoma]